MATNKVITVTTPSVVTNDTLASYNAYSDQDGSLGSLSVAEAAAGKTFALSDGVVHSVTVKPVGTSSGEYNAPSNAVTVDLSGSTTYGIGVDSANNEVIITDFSLGTTGEWSVSFRSSYISSAAGRCLMATKDRDSGSSGGLAVVVPSTSVGQNPTPIILKLTDAAGTKTTSSYNYADGDLVTVDRVGDVVNIKINGITQESITLSAAFSFSSRVLTFGAMSSTGLNGQLTALFEEITCGGETLIPTEHNSGSLIDGTTFDITLYTGSGVINDMYIAL